MRRKLQRGNTFTYAQDLGDTIETVRETERREARNRDRQRERKNESASGGERQREEG